MKRVAILLFALVTGCALTPEQRVEQMVKDYGPICEGLGVYRSSDKWQQCIIQQDSAEQEKRRAGVQAYLGWLKAQKEERDRINAINAANRPRRTHCFQSGQNIDCTTY